MNLLQELPRLLPAAIAWAEARAARAAEVGESLTLLEQDLARSVGVAAPERVRVETVERLPLPEDATLRAAALQAGLLGPNMTGLTLGHSIFICRGTRLAASCLTSCAMSTSTSGPALFRRFCRST